MRFSFIYFDLNDFIKGGDFPRYVGKKMCFVKHPSQKVEMAHFNYSIG